MKIEEKLKKEFINSDVGERLEYALEYDNYPTDHDEIADWWIAKIKEAETEKIKNLQKVLLDNAVFIQDYGQFFKKDVFNLIDDIK